MYLQDFLFKSGWAFGGMKMCVGAVWFRSSLDGSFKNFHRNSGTRNKRRNILLLLSFMMDIGYKTCLTTSNFLDMVLIIKWKTREESGRLKQERGVF